MEIRACTSHPERGRWFSMRAQADDTAAIRIYDHIGRGGVTDADFANQLDALGEVDALNVFINSPGGDVFMANAIHNMLKRHQAAVTVTVDGLAASAASVVAMAGDDVVMPSNAMLFLHNPWALAVGYADDLRDAAAMLDKVAPGIASTYRQKSGLSEARVRALMNDESWLTAQEAVDLGLANRVTDAVTVNARFDLSMYPDPPKSFAAPTGIDAATVYAQRRKHTR